MYEFTGRANNVLEFAKEFSKTHNYSFIGTEHILYGLVKEEDGLAAKILLEQGLTVDYVTQEILNIDGVMNTSCENLDFTPRAKRIIENSGKESKRFGQNYVGTEHILLSLMREIDSVAVRILIDANVDPQKVFADLLRLLSEDSPFANTSDLASNKNNISSNTPTLNQYGKNLTSYALENKLDPVIGRDEQMQRVIEILSRRTKNNPVLVGEPGVGKTAVIEGLAQMIAFSKVPEVLKGKKIVSLDLSSMVAGAKYRGDFEDRLKKSLAEIKKENNIILFIDELHTIIGAGAAEGTMDAANILKPLLSRGEVQIIGATTMNEYRKYILKDSALERRFQTVVIDEPDTNDTILMLEGLKDKYEAHHKVKITPQAISSAVLLSKRYINDRCLPDKAIDLIDEACSKVKLKNVTMPENITKLQENVEKLSKEKEEAIISQSFEQAAKLRDKEKKLKEKLKVEMKKWENNEKNMILKITEEDICNVLSNWTKIPVSKLSQTESQKLKELDKTLSEHVIGQDMAVKLIARCIKRARVGLKDEKRPIGSFLFLGPTGVGKTELTKVLASVLFGDENSMIRFDMSEYMESHSVSKLIGAPPGYVGFDEGGQLTEAVRRKPYSIILFDEIEKANTEVFNMFLQILDDGRLTDSNGRTIDFKNTVIIMTSNIGARNIVENRNFGFKNGNLQEQEYEKTKSQVMSELKKEFRPEFLNRIDEIVVFNKLTKEDIKKIAVIMLDELKSRLLDKKIEVTFSDNVIEYIASIGYDDVYGARPLRRYIQTNIEDKLAEEILDSNIKEGDNILVDYIDGNIFIQKK